jgi:hypothetical protein
VTYVDDAEFEIADLCRQLDEARAGTCEAPPASSR